MEVRVRILFKYLIRGVVLVGRWVVVVTPVTVLKIKKTEKVKHSFVFIPVIRISNFKIKNKYKVKNFLVIIL